MHVDATKPSACISSNWHQLAKQFMFEVVVSEDFLNLHAVYDVSYTVIHVSYMERNQNKTSKMAVAKGQKYSLMLLHRRHT